MNITSSTRGATLGCALVALATTAACSTPAPPGPAAPSPTGERSIDGLLLMENTAFQLAYAREDLDLSRYTSVMFDNPTVSYLDDPGNRRRNSPDRNYALTPTQMANLASIFVEEMETALSEDGGYSIVSEPGPDVLEITPYLTNLVVRYPTDPAVSRDSYVRSYGEVTMILELRDSRTQQILARVGERGDPTSTPNGLAEVSPSFVRADVTDLFRFWGEKARERLDQVRTGNYGGG